MKYKEYTLPMVILSILLLLLCQTASARIEFTAPPESLEELVESSDVILTGRLESVVDNSLFYGYQSSAQELRKLDQQTPIQIGLYKTDFHLKTNKILKGYINKENLIIRVLSSKISDIRETNSAMKKNKDKIQKQLFFLRENPDATYSLNSTMGALFFKKTFDDKGIETEQIIVKSQNKDFPAFGNDYNAQMFIDEISQITH